MGLDNIPYNYPCKVGGTAVMVNLKDRETGEDILDDDGDVITQIDCNATQECGGCTWKSDLGALEGSVGGIFGTSCWYRGKYGAHLLESTDIPADELWGDDDAHVSPATCNSLADEMENYMENYTEDDGGRVILRYSEETEDVSTEYVYFMKWLRWVAEKCGGASAWY